MTETAPVTAQRFSMRQVVERIGFDASTIARWCRQGIFPPPHYIAGRKRWWLHDIQAWEDRNVSDKPSKDPRKKK